MFELLGQALVGWILADLIGGFVHWYQDRVARPRWGFLERHLWGPNRLHHVEPLDFAKSGFWERNSTTVIAALAVALPLFTIFGFSWVLVFATIGGCVQNEVHLWTHKPRDGWIKVLQQIGIIQSVAGHARHHKPPQNRNYCILTDWVNPILERLKVWERLERAFRIEMSHSA